jgi:integrase
MTSRTIFTEAGVRRLKPPAVGQEDQFERLKRGLTLVLRNSYGGTRAWRVVYYANGNPHTKTLGHFPELSVKAAREAAFAFDPKAASQRAEAGSFKEVAEDWLKRYVDKRKLRSKYEIVRQLNYYLFPRWANVRFFDISRGTVNKLLDEIEDENGASQADGVLATLRAMMNWYATRNEDYNSPIVKGMKRDRRDPRERSRARVLSDDEIRALWKATEDGGSFGGILRLLLLTAQRREKIVTMKWDDIADGVWTIATKATRVRSVSRRWRSRLSRRSR